MNTNRKVQIELSISQADIDLARGNGSKEALFDLIFDVGKTVLQCAIHQEDHEHPNQKNPKVWK